MSLRIALVTEVWHPSINGVVTRLDATVRELRSLDHEVLVVAPSPGRGSGYDGKWGQPGDDPAVQVRTVPTFRLPFVYGGQPWGLPLPRVDRYLEEFGPDVVHVANPAMLGIAGVRAARRNRWPLVCSYHTDIASYASCYHLGWLRPFIWWMLRRLHGGAALNLVTSKTSADRLAGAGIGGRPDGTGRVELWPRGVDLDRFRPGDRTASLNGRPAHVRALYVGRLAPEKGLVMLAQLASAPGVHLMLVGDGPGRGELLRHLPPAGVTFTGVLHGDALADAYRGADVFVFPSTTDTLGLCLLEAMATGLPIVAADSPATREVLGSSSAARLFPADRPERIVDVVAELLDAAPRSVHASHARSQVEGQTWATATARLCELYEEAMAGTPKPCARSPRFGRRLGRFTLVGISNATLDLGIYNLALVIAPTTSTVVKVAYNTVAVVVALTNSWVWNSRWTFGDRVSAPSPRLRRRRRLLFAVQGALNLGVNDGVVAAVSAALAAAGVLQNTLGSNLAKLAAMFTASLTSFAAMHLVVFRKAHRAVGTAH